MCDLVRQTDAEMRSSGTETKCSGKKNKDQEKISFNRVHARGDCELRSLLNIPGKTNHYFGNDYFIDEIYPRLVNF